MRARRRNGPAAALAVLAKLAKLVALVALVALLVPVAVRPAFAYTYEGFRWQIGSVGTYCISPTVTAHGWTSTIQLEVSRYNSIVQQVTSKPTWERTGTSSCSTQQIIVNQVALPSTLCGQTSFVLNGSGLAHSTVSYNSQKTFHTAGRSGQCSLEWTTLHELGHSQGLGHSSVSSAVMWPVDNGATFLQPDDVAGIQSIY